MRLTDPLNERQLQVLRWISDGCPDGVMTGHSYKTTARALQDRKLVTVSRKGSGWSAEVTTTGTYYLKHGGYPLKNAVRRQPPPAPRPTTTNKVATATPPTNPPVDKPTKISATDQLVADVLAAGGSLEIEPRRVPGRDTVWETAKLARLANRMGKTPPGKRLVHKVVRDGDHWSSPRHDLIVLEDGPAGTDTPLTPVPVPEKVTRYHAAVAALRKADRLRLASAGRASRILHAIAVEAEQRDFAVRAHLPPSTYRQEPWHLLLTLGNETVPLRISEETDRVEHVPTAKELTEKAKYSWTRIPTHDHVASGRLRIDLGGPAQTERKSFWADRASWTLDEKLPEVLREIAVRADDLRLRREAKARAEQAHQEAVEQERERARLRAAEAHRLEVLQHQLKQWREAGELREYAAAIENRVAAEPTPETNVHAVTEALRWLAWIRQLADRLDPTRTLPAWPVAPDLPSYKLQEFMRRVPEPDGMRYQPETY